LAKVNTNLDLQEAVHWLKDTHHVDVISTSIGYYNLTPGDGTGEFADQVQDARDAGVFWATAASNDRESHWGGPYTDTNGNRIHEFDGKEINCFGPGGDQCFQIEAGYALHVFLRWDDWTHVDQDYDLYLLKWDGARSSWIPIASSAVRQGGKPGQTPTEDALAVTSGPATAYGISIQRFDSTRNVNLELFAPKFVRLNTLLHARSLSNLADAPAAMTVAAIDVRVPYPQEPYSSQGPTNGPGGNATGGLSKPDISAYARVSTENAGAQSFGGTSAATAHVAGAAALVLDAYPGYAPAQVQSFLQGRALDLGSAGQDTVYGHGRLHLGDPPSVPVAAITPNAALYSSLVHISDLSGSRFEPGATVKLSRSNHPDIQATDVTWVSATRLTCDLDLIGAANGPWDVVVTNPDGRNGSLVEGFEVTAPSTAPRITKVTPPTGRSTEVIPLSIVGRNFDTRPGPKPIVKLTKLGQPDIVASGVTVVDPATIHSAVNLVGAAAGLWNVVVTNPNGEHWTLTDGFWVINRVYLPLVARCSPSIALQPIDNPDGNGRYVVKWTWAACGASVSSYELQVDDDPGFGSPAEISIPDPEQIAFTAYTPTPGTYYWRARGHVTGQGWSPWSGAQSTTVSNWFAYVWVENDTSDTLTVEIVGLDKRNFDVGTHYWLRTAPGRYTVKAWAHCGPGSWEWNLIAGENTLKFNCSSGTATDARTHDAESSLSGSLDNTR
jgi:hypothetical protein